MRSLSDPPIFDPRGDVLLEFNKPAAVYSGSDIDSEMDDSSIQMRSATVKEPGCGDSGHSGEGEEVAVKVSSRHLALASRVFRAMFDGDFSERVEDGLGGPVRVALPDDDLEAMIVMLSIVHGRNKRVPRKIKRPLFVKIAVLIDKYELHEAAEMYTEIWFRDLWDQSRPQSSELGDWIFLCWVFRKEAEFRILTRRAVMESGQHFEDHDLPFPEQVTTGIEEIRLSAVDTILVYLTTTIEHYSRGGRQCKEPEGRHVYCDSQVLGDLIRELRAIRLYPIPPAASLDVSIERLIASLCAMRLTSLCELTRDKRDRSSFVKSCVLQSKLHTEMERVDAQVTGLNFPTIESATPPKKGDSGSNTPSRRSIRSRRIMVT